MEFNANMVTKDGKKMLYLIYIKVNKDCEDYDAIWAELERRMKIVDIVRVDWTLYDDKGNSYDECDGWFYAQTFEEGMGFVSGIMKVHEIRSNLEFCNFYNGDADKYNIRKYRAEDVLKAAKECIAKYEPNEIW